MSWTIDDEHGNQLGAGIQSSVVARRAAQAKANHIGRPVFLYDDAADGDGSEEFKPVKMKRKSGKRKTLVSASRLTPAHLRSLQDKERAIRSAIDASASGVKSPAQIKREVDAVLKGGVAMVPGISKWSVTAGGVSAAPGKNGYTFTNANGGYTISPFSSDRGRHLGYTLGFWTHGEKPRHGHSGLHHQIGKLHRSPAAAAAAAKSWDAENF